MQILHFFGLRGADKQWGSGSIPAGYASKIVFPTTFKTINYMVIPSGSLTTGDVSYNKTTNVLLETRTPSSILIRTNMEKSPTALYIAIGY